MAAFLRAQAGAVAEPTLFRLPEVGLLALGTSAWGKSLPPTSTELSGVAQLPVTVFPTGSQVRGTERKDEG